VSRDLRKARGARGEHLAEEHLLRAGYSVVERNFRTRYGELDLVASRADALVFCEVKTRSAGSCGGPDGPLEAIGAGKRRQLRLMAAQWLASRAGEGRSASAVLRFEAIGITLSPSGDAVELQHVEDAF
jgi:putative endonuclease